ncbi:MAG: sugar kinase [Acetatifactor sp.]|nr:sugar kinase [Acetatifactor sp.]
MDRGMNKIVLVTRKTRLEELVYKYNTLEQAKFYIEHLGVDFSDYLEEDQRYQQAVKEVLSAAERFARVQVIDRSFVPNMIFGSGDVVIAVGQDGLVANVMKYLDGQPLVGVNPDTKRWDGVLLPFEPGQMSGMIPSILAGKYQVKDVTMAQADTADGQRMLAVNDLFIGCRTHASARYHIICNGSGEDQSSSGIIVSTGLGSTGWYASVIEQARQIAAFFRCGQIQASPLAWGAERLTFVVREPFPSRATQTGIVFGAIEGKDDFRIISQMPSGGVVFSDGMEADAIEFHSGTEIRIGIADKRGKLVVS